MCKTDWTGNDFVGERAGSTAIKSKARNSGVSARRPGLERAEEEDGEDIPNGVEVEIDDDDDDNNHNIGDDSED